MNLTQLETLIAINEHGSFARAGAMLGATQSTVSARIRELERYVGAELFDRAGYRVQLTPVGEDLLNFAHQFVGRARGISRRFRQPEDISGLVRLGVVGLVAHTWLPALVKTLHERYPGLTLRLDVGLTRTLAEHLRQGTIEFAILAGSMNDPNLMSQTIGFDEFGWTAGRSLVLPERSLGPEDLREHPILTLSEDSYHYPVIERWFQKSGVAYENLISCNSMNVIAALTEAGLGISLLPQRCYREEIRTGRLRSLRTHPRFPKVEFSFVTRRTVDEVVSAATFDVIREVSDLAPEAA